MVELTADSRLIKDYEAIRRREYDLITNLLDVLPKIDNVSDEQIGQVRDALFHADHPFLMVFVGPFSSGKSSLINALLGAELLRIGPVPTTDRISILRWGEEPQNTGSAGDVDTVFYPSPMLQKVSFVDTPGLESIFKDHEETTRRFLHRSDVVCLVMLATQAMTQSNLDYLKVFKEYGKKVVVAINQADLISEEERETVREYVYNHCKDRLGFTPDVWMVSARQGLEAQTGEQRNESLWQVSGLNRFEDYINDQLGDADRLRQKLKTPLAIVQNVHQHALKALRANQARFDPYRSIADNISQQLNAQKRNQAQAVRDTTDEIALRFMRTADRSGEALRDIFQLSRALGSLGRGLMELVGLARLFRRGDQPSQIRQIFDKYKVFEPIDELPRVVDKLPARLEGQDMQDIDALVKYGHREVAALPDDIRSRVIGTIQAPIKYDREPLLTIRDELEAIEQQAREVETENLEQIRRNTLLYLAVWELIIVVLMIALVSAWGALDVGVDGPVSLIGLVLLLAGALAGFAVLPLRGRVMHTNYTNRLIKLQARYIDIITTASDKQIEYGMQLRHDTIAPLTRLVEAQNAIHDEQFTRLQAAEQAITKIEAELNALGKRRILGVTF